MTGFATNFYGLILSGVDIAVSHNIKLRMAVNTLHAACQMHVRFHHALAGPGDGSGFIESSQVSTCGRSHGFVALHAKPLGRQSGHAVADWVTRLDF